MRLSVGLAIAALLAGCGEKQFDGKDTYVSSYHATAFDTGQLKRIQPGLYYMCKSGPKPTAPCAKGDELPPEILNPPSFTAIAKDGQRFHCAQEDAATCIELAKRENSGTDSKR